MEINELEIYAKKYPNISIEELIKKIKKEERKQTLEDDNIRKENEKKWFNDLVGKYIFIEFSDSSFLVFYCNKSLLRPFYDAKFECFKIYRSSKGFELGKEERAINYLWFNCPYSDKIVGDDSTKVEIITEEKYNQIAEIYKTMKSQTKEWLSTK